MTFSHNSKSHRCENRAAYTKVHGGMLYPVEHYT